MSSTYEPSVEQLREESERSRDALASTVEQLRDTVGNSATELRTLVSPAHIKKEVRNFVREERDSIAVSIKQRAKDNPLQMAAIGAAVAYPALSFLRAIPTPLLLIGAGLFLTSKRGQQSANDIKAKVDDLVQQGTELVQQGTEKVSDLTAEVRSDLEDRIAGARYQAEDIRDTVAAAAGAVTDKAQSVFRTAADNTKGTVIAANEAVDGAASKIAAASQRFTNAASETAASAINQAAAIGASSRDGVINFVNENALLVAGIGAAVGAFIAASIPSSDAENRLFGPSSETLKGKAREAAAQGIEGATNIVADAAGAVATAAAREGIDATGVQRALNTVADSVRKVADRGMETALGSTAPSGEQSNSKANTQRNAT